MNLHFKDREIFERLTKATLYKCIIGSHMYKINDENSDKDYLYIYVPAINQLHSPFMNHHQLQYKEDGVDHIFVNVFTFIKNILNGDSTINLEVICCDDIKNSCLSFLYDNREMFFNYKILKSYDGMSRRDMSQIEKQPSDREKNKKLAHALRGHEFSKMVLNKTLNPIISDELKMKIDVIKNISTYYDRLEVIKELKEDVENFRIMFNVMFNNKNLGLPTFMDVKSQNIIDKCLISLVNSDIYQSKKEWYLSDTIMTKYYNSNENQEIQY